MTRIFDEKTAATRTTGLPQTPGGQPLGRDVIFDYLRAAGIDSVFGVPGTNEIPIIDGTDADGEGGITYVPCLHENIAMGAAMGYARATGRPGVVELHVTPGAGHGLGNLFNAHKSHIPVVVLCGQQHSNLLIQEPLLASDLVQVARQYTKWAYEVRGPDEMGMAMQRAIKTALAPPTGPVFLSIPWEFTIQPVETPSDSAARGRTTRIASGFTGDLSEIRRAAVALAGSARPIVVAGDGVGAADAWDELRELVEAINAPVYTEPLSSYMNYPNSLPHWQGPLPSTQEGMREVFRLHDHAFLCGFNGQAQVVVFDWDDGPLIPDGVRQIYLHNDPWEIGKNYYGEMAILGDIKTTLPVLTREVGECQSPVDRKAAEARGERIREIDDAQRKGVADRLRAAESSVRDRQIPATLVAKCLADLQESRNLSLTFVDEAISDSPAFQTHLRFDRPTGYLGSEGGSLGYSMPASLGVRKALGENEVVVNAVGDGSALFYPQSWWTAHRLGLAILYIVMNNGEYKTLMSGLKEIWDVYGWHSTGYPKFPEYLALDGESVPGPRASGESVGGVPDAKRGVDYVHLAGAYGIGGRRVSRYADLETSLAEGLDQVAKGRSYLVEVLTDDKLPSRERAQDFTAFGPPVRFSEFFGPM
ncbi:thiamine pyrophosphate-binding protein [Actinorugispora endophytica]|uniref:Benzoylformate decarboxylase n=1 Tax=Actinorugispora endophytica TaxID=1605990 RepID=A0A4R6UY96_9ACTN|nr:thiamine pyrophosphate-binding protein [Actinorugispora endophytica]TDQ52280.1 benzoylformate decarboxylase [Actinorugispora endophytica]